MKIKDLIGKKVAAFVSGGLDSTSIICWMSLKGVKVIAVIVDLGQPDEDDFDDITRRMKLAGAEDAIIVDGKKILAQFMLKVIQGQAYYESGYLNTTGIARMATVVSALPEIKKLGIKFITHGATGRGNDQVRFELATTMLNPSINIYAPWRDSEFIKELGGRKEMIDYCHKHNLEISATLESPYSTDANFCGLTHEAGKLEYLNIPPDFIDFIMGVHPTEVVDPEEFVSICFVRGIPTEINGMFNNLLDIFFILNYIAGKHGVGIGLDMVENRRIGIKSRGVYEAPGCTFLMEAYSKMLEFVLHRKRRRFFDIVSRQLADVVYDGEWFDSFTDDLLSVVDNVAQLVTGKVTYRLYKGKISFVSAEDVIHSLYDSESSSMEKVGDFNHEDMQGYMNIANVAARTLVRAGQVRKI